MDYYSLPVSVRVRQDLERKERMGILPATKKMILHGDTEGLRVTITPCLADPDQLLQEKFKKAWSVAEYGALLGCLSLVKLVKEAYQDHARLGFLQGVALYKAVAASHIEITKEALGWEVEQDAVVIASCLGSASSLRNQEMIDLLLVSAQNPLEILSALATSSLIIQPHDLDNAMLARQSFDSLLALLSDADLRQLHAKISSSSDQWALCRIATRYACELSETTPPASSARLSVRL